jgi:hypothetical protein
MLDPQLIAIPKLDLLIPEPAIKWAYQAYTGLVLEVAELELEGVPDQLNGLWSAWGDLHARLWSPDFDLINAFGYTNVLASEKAKELSYGKSLYDKSKDVFAEAIRTKNLRLYLATRLDIEKQRQMRYLQEQGLQMEYAKGLIEASVEAYNLAVRVFEANISALELETKRWSAITAQNAVELKRLEEAYEEAHLASELIRGELRRQTALAGVLSASANVQRLLLEIQLNGAKVQAAEVEVQRLALQALLVGTQQIEIQAQTLSLQVDTEVIKAQGAELAVLAAANDQINAQIVNINSIRVARDAMYAQAITDKEALLVDLTKAEAALVAAHKAFALAQGVFSTARLSAEITKYTSDDTVEDARMTSGFVVEDAQFDSQNALYDARTAGELAVDEARVIADGNIDGAKISTEAAMNSARFSAETTLTSARIGAEVKTGSGKITSEMIQNAAKLSAEMVMDAARINAEMTAITAKHTAEGIMHSGQLNAETIINSGRASADATANSAKLAAEITQNSGRLSAEMKAVSSREQANMITTQARTSAEVSTISAGALHNASLIAMESENRIKMEAVKLSTDLAIQISEAVSRQTIQVANFGLEIQKLVSSWAIERDTAEVQAIQQDIAGKTDLANLSGRGTIAKARAEAAATLANAKVTNYFTEYRS